MKIKFKKNPPKSAKVNIKLPKLNPLPLRMALQLALTTLESLAEMLNERKRESEQAAAFRDKLRGVSGKLVRGSIDSR